jgi:hypothetical protein
MTPDDLFADFLVAFRARAYTSGLLIALIDMLTALGVPGSGISSFDNLLERFPRRMTTRSGGPANTLTLEIADGQTVKLRSFYDAVERYFHQEEKRFRYPSMAPHATQAWPDYRHWLDSLVTYNAAELAHLRQRVVDLVLDTYESQAFDPSTVIVEPPLFRIILEEFETNAKRGEPTGASFQGIVFGFLRADNPHLQIEIDKVRTGSKRLQRVGDVDAWEGGRLAITTEVKQFEIDLDTLADLAGFANEAGRRGALGIIAGLSFQSGAREAAREAGLIPIDRGDMLRIVELWDPVKQRVAVASFVYYATHVEKNEVLSKRLNAFLSEASTSWSEQRATLAEDASAQEAASVAQNADAGLKP